MKLTKQTWIGLIVIGLSGQFAWSIENMYFNVFLYNTISQNPHYIADMVALSAISATVTTLLMGSLSDKLGKRKVFISLGYILWGISTLSFGFISVGNISKLFGLNNGVAVTAMIVILMDCVMTFFGSTANDAAFNAYITDITEPSNRGKIESVLSTLPLISMLIIFGVFDPLTQRGEWTKFFLIFGLTVTAVGILSMFLLKESAPKAKSQESFLRNLTYGFRIKVIKENRNLYTALSALMIYSVAVQVFFPYLIIYIQNYLKINAYALVLGVVLTTASVISVVGGKFIDKIGKMKLIFPCVAVMFVGLILMYFAVSVGFVIASAIIMMGGYMLVTAILSATLRDYTPSDKAGMFQGIRMIFAVLIPMVTGPYIGSAVIKSSAQTYVELGVVKSVPTPNIFLASAAILILTLVPLISLKKRHDSLKADIKQVKI